MPFFDDPDMDFAARCVLSGVRHGMSEVGETLAALDLVTDGDADSWLDAFVALGRRLRSVADEADRHGHRYSAWNAALRSANYLYAGLWWAPVTQRASQQGALWEEHRASWDLAVAHWPSPVEPLELVVAGAALPGLWFTSPAAAGDHAPAVVLVQGLGTPISDICMTGLDGALARGHHVVVVDGPGQGDALQRRGRTLDDSWTAVIGATVEWVAARPEVDPAAISLLGVGAGSLFAARAAAAESGTDEQQPAALVLDPAVVDLGEDAAGAVEGAGDERARHLLGATITAPTGTTDLAAGVDVLRRHRLTESEAAAISCPTLVVTADQAFGFRGQEGTLLAWMQAPTDHVVLEAVDGAGADNGIDASQVHDAAVFDWLDATLGLGVRHDRHATDVRRTR